MKNDVITAKLVPLQDVHLTPHTQGSVKSPNSKTLVFGFAAERVKFPALVGYLVAGVALSPYTPGLYADVNLAARHVPAEAASIEAAADEPLTVGREQPDAGSLDVDRDAGGFRDARERVVDAGIRITAMRGEREQRALLPPQPPLGYDGNRYLLHGADESNRST